MYRYAAFDMDGTLLDTMDYWHKTLMIYAELHGIEISDEQIFKDAVNMEFFDAIQYITKHCDISEIRNITRGQILETLEYCYKNRAVPRQGVIKMLETLKLNGVRMCVISATPLNQVKIALKYSGLADYFEFVLTPEDYPACKTEPDIFLEAARRFGCDISEMAMFEDAYYSMKTAKSLNMYVIAVKEKYEKRNFDRIKAISDEFYDEFTDLKYDAFLH